MDSFYYTYVLYSEKDKKKYVGYTQNLKLRFEAHCDGKVKSTKYRRPLKLIYYEACLSKEDALKREKYMKTYHGKMFLGNRLKSYLTGLIWSFGYSGCEVPRLRGAGALPLPDFENFLVKKYGKV